MKIESTLNDDRTIADVVVDGNRRQMTVTHVDQAIRDLMALRERMAPHVPENFAPAGDMQIHFGPSWSMPGQSMDHAILHLRHPAAGWLHFAFPEPSAQLLATCLANASAVLRGEAEANDQTKPGSQDAGISRNDPATVN